MKIKVIESRYRRDLNVTYICEHCGHEVRGSGYDDANFHQKVIPKMICASCGKDAGKDYIPLIPKYPADRII